MLKSKIIVLTGPESSGKTHIGRVLSQDFGIPIIEEYSRKYIHQLERPYEESDLIIMAELQYADLNELDESTAFLLMDTDALTIKIWSEEKYQKCDPTILELLERYPPFCYLLCKPDISWEKDPQRENPSDRDRLFDIYLAEIDILGIPYHVIEGNFLERKERAKSVLSAILKE